MRAVLAALGAAIARSGGLLATALSTKDNSSGDLHKMMFGAGFFLLAGLDIYATVWLRQTFDLTGQATALGIYFGGAAGSQLLKAKTEPGG